MNQFHGHSRTVLEPRCDQCEQKIRRDEPVVWLNAGLARVTRVSAEHELETMGRRGELYHRRCYATRPRGITGSVVAKPAPPPVGHPERALAWF